MVLDRLSVASVDLVLVHQVERDSDRADVVFELVYFILVQVYR